MSDYAGTSQQEETPQGAIVVVAKCPIPGKSKTRLKPLLGEEGSAVLARALLSDVLVTLSDCSQVDEVTKILLYAPSDDEGHKIMSDILQSLNLHDWKLLPQMSCDLLASDVGASMADALKRARGLVSRQGSSVLFLGMDAPELPLDEITTALLNPSHAVVCPARDGGFAMLCIPHYAPCPEVLTGVRWSQSLTAVSQLKALTDNNVAVRLGRLMHDMDEPDDVKELAERLLNDRSGEVGDSDGKLDGLVRSSGLSRMPPTTGKCENTWNALLSLGVIEKDTDEGVLGSALHADTVA